MKNIEVKYCVRNFRDVRVHLKGLGAKYAGRWMMTDTYYRSRKGRLKIRECDNQSPQLIYYERPNALRPRVSRYVVIPLDKKCFPVLRTTFGTALGVAAVVVKKRELWLYCHTRIHLDSVRGIGTYLELETVCRSISPVKARSEFQTVARALKYSTQRPVAQSYLDLFLERRRARRKETILQ